jgi:transcriptional regulator with XRE-family HTH domain
MIFNKKLFLDNLDFYMKRKSVKASELEEKAGVSKGYISRIKKPGNQTVPGIDFILSLSSVFETTVETLCTINCSRLSNDEWFYIELFNKLIHKTKNKEIIWRRNTLKDLINHKSSEVIAEETSFIPDVSFEFLGGKKYKSSFEYGDYRFASTEGDFYSYSVDENHTLCIVMVNLISEEDKRFGLEMFMISDNKKSNVCCCSPYSLQESDILFVDLYNLVKDSININCMDQETRKILTDLIENS